MASNKPHAVCVPYPAQGHINPMFKLAKLLHFKGFHITFVNTDYNHKRLLKSGSLNSISGLPDFCFEAIPDGLPVTNDDSTQDIPSLSDSTSKHCLVPFRNLIHRLNGNDSCSNIDGSPRRPLPPPVSCIVSDGGMSFTLDVAEEVGIPEVVFWTPSACGVLAYSHYPVLVQRGLIPLEDASHLTNGYLETTIDWIPGMKNIRLKDLPTFIRTTDPNSIMLNFVLKELAKSPRAKALILNTFDALEQNVLNVLSSMFPCICTIGPLHLLSHHITVDNPELRNISLNLWEENKECIEWLDSQKPNSVVYVNFGSTAVITRDQLNEFAWGIANSKKPFLWITRPDLVNNMDTETLFSPEFLEETKDRGILAGWCPQEQVLNHKSVGIFLSHMGWNSTIESVCAGVPLLCWPFFAEQQTNCWFACNEWGIGMEINGDVKRDEVEELVRELFEGEKAKQMKKRAMDWKIKAEEAIRPNGVSYQNFEKLLAILENKQK